MSGQLCPQTNLRSVHSGRFYQDVAMQKLKLIIEHKVLCQDNFVNTLI